MIMKANNGGDDFEEDESPFNPDVPLNVDDRARKLEAQMDTLDLRVDQQPVATAPKMLRRRLMEDIRNLSVAR